MNRPIKFRGKRIDNGEWVYGYLVYSEQQDRYYIGVTEIMTPVDSETVGQFTGLHDKNGKEIYEGDVLNVCNGSINGIQWMEDPRPVKYIPNKGFDMPMFCWDKNGNEVMDSTHWCEVIGNIYEDYQ